MRRGFAEDLLALLMARGKAAAIVGDLVELCPSRRRGWFTREVIRLVLGFWIRGLWAAPGRALGSAGLGVGVYAGVYAGLFVASGLPWYPWQRIHEPGFLARVCLVVFASNLLTGGILGRLASSWGSRGVASLTAVWCAAWLIWPLLAWRFSPWPTEGEIVLAALLFPLVYQLPLLAGAIVAQRLSARVIA